MEEAEGGGSCDQTGMESETGCDSDKSGVKVDVEVEGGGVTGKGGGMRDEGGGVNFRGREDGEEGGDGRQRHERLGEGEATAVSNEREGDKSGELASLNGGVGNEGEERTKCQGARSEGAEEGCGRVEGGKTDAQVLLNAENLCDKAITNQMESRPLKFLLPNNSMDECPLPKPPEMEVCLLVCQTERTKSLGVKKIHIFFVYLFRVHLNIDHFAAISPMSVSSNETAKNHVSLVC